MLELVRDDRPIPSTASSVINNTPVLRLRDRLLPLVSLRDAAAAWRRRRGHRTETFIVVTQVGAYTFGIIVDRVFDTEEIVVKPVAPILRHISMFSRQHHPRRRLGDHDPRSQRHRRQHRRDRRLPARADRRDGGGARSACRGPPDPLLVFRAGGTDLKAVPLALVARLEEIEVGQIEHSHGKPVVQYRGQLMPLVQHRRRFDHSATRAASRSWCSPTATAPWAWWSTKSSTSSRNGSRSSCRCDQPGLIGTAVVVGQGDRHHRCRLLSDPGLGRLVRCAGPGIPRRKPKASVFCWSTTARSSATC